MSELCREFGISRKTGYKFLERYRQFGPVGLYDVPPVAQHIPHRTAEPIIARLVELRESHPSWGAKKIRQRLLELEPGLKLPAPSTITDVLRRRGLVKRRSKRRGVSRALTGCTEANATNELWCTDFKGQFRLGNRQYCFPLTLTDQRSRYILACEALNDTKAEPAKAVLEMAFRRYGMPLRIRSDNGTPFASRGLAGLSRLSVWWLRLGIVPERIEPGNPQQNGRHERMHRTLKAETTRPAGANLLQQQERFDRFVELFNNERPHEALEQQRPCTVYEPSPRPYPERLPDPDYSLDDVVLRVTPSGYIHLPGFGGRGRLYLSQALSDELVGLREVDDDLWAITFTTLKLGTWNTRTGAFSPLPAPAAAESNLSQAENS